ncbi:MAG: glycosyltransferase family 9 protein [Bacteroidetes bacterium]|nr:glycosyltransferase family 9 protein [Bacteroidota bacterium]MBU1371399.1 glycosyltransferase family 9 protein [Bacteroidota bacterium]MBU1485670.1 glycosyltransferase family 9 protein [Bacteroidota bacterium]MBU1761898.1 glycosyltransferase family 9 protein [Bacteroidota bacterium]MBU2269133.1 glycosyltransferase family 9 protein [Bacteroidota bacterium]
MGDIIYTSPVIRCLKNQLENVEIHYLTKPAFKFLLDENPYLHKLHLLKPKLSETIKALKAENFDDVIDLHSSLRSLLVKVSLGVKSSTYQKERLKKWMAIKLKINKVEPIHLVDRYLKAVAFLGIKNDGMPIDYFLPNDVKGIEEILPGYYSKPYVAFIIGATHFTKRMPNKKVIATIQKIKIPVILLGGKDVSNNADIITSGLSQEIVNLTGIISLNESVVVVKNAAYVIGFDTGLTHIAEAFNKKLVTIWGSTVPELLGVKPYKVDKHLEVSIDLDCRPCSKFGLSACPKGHFKCMNDINEQQIADFIEYE